MSLFLATITAKDTIVSVGTKSSFPNGILAPFYFALRAGGMGFGERVNTCLRGLVFGGSGKFWNLRKL